MLHRFPTHIAADRSCCLRGADHGRQFTGRNSADPFVEEIDYPATLEVGAIGAVTLTLSVALNPGSISDRSLIWDATSISGAPGNSRRTGPFSASWAMACFIAFHPATPCLSLLGHTVSPESTSPPSERRFQAKPEEPATRHLSHQAGSSRLALAVSPIRRSPSRCCLHHERAHWNLLQQGDWRVLDLPDRQA